MSGFTAPKDDPKWNQLDHEYKVISGQIGESYIKLMRLKKEMSLFVKQRDDVLSKFHFYQAELAAAEAKKTDSNG